LGRLGALLILMSFGLMIARPLDARAVTQQAQAQQGALELLAVPLPDLSALPPPVQKRLRDAHETVTATVQRPAISPPAAADAFAEMGKLFMATRFSEEAERSFRNAERLAFLDPRWPYYLGHVLRNAGDLPGAAEAFERARRLRPADFPTLVWLGRMYLDLARPAEAEVRLGEALKLRPDQAVVRFELGRAALARQQYALAVEHLTAALTLGSDTDAVHYPLALAYRGLGDLAKANDHLERRAGRGSRRATAGMSIPFPDPLIAALDGIIQTPQMYRERGLDAAAVGNWREAAEYYRRGVEADPNYAAMRVNLGIALERIGDARGALEQYRAALDLDPRLPEAHYGLGELLERGGRDREAIEQYRAAVTESPTFAAAHLKLADALRRTDRLDESLSQYREVLALEPADAPSRFGEAMALVRLERYAEAIERLTEATKVHPQQPAFLQALARLLAAAPDDRVRDGERAWKLVEGISKEASHPGAFETLAMVLAELGHFNLALDWQRLAMSAASRAGRPDVAQKMAANLARYVQRQPCRVPWRDDDPDHRPGPVVVSGLLDAVPAK
jgi:tetratricopeptide (TPR) repeat protein